MDIWAGVPLDWIEKLRAWELVFGVVASGFVASEVTDAEVLCKYCGEGFIDVGGLGTPPTHVAFGGISGSPLWRFTRTAGKMELLTLAGVVQRQNTEFEWLFAGRPDCLSSDGRM